jgi:hypothetical protein
MLSAAADGGRTITRTRADSVAKGTKAIPTMFISILRSDIEPIGPDRVATPFSPRVDEDCPRALHARLLANAAARRLRAVERRNALREEDADYWLHAAPVAVERAAEMRCKGRLPRLP